MFRTVSDRKLPRLFEQPFEQFRVSDDLVPDVNHGIYQIVADHSSASDWSHDEVVQLSEKIHGSPEILESLLVRSSQVSEILRSCLSRLEDVHIGIDRHYIIVRDYSKAQLDFLYFPELGDGQYDPIFMVASNFRPLFSSFLPIYFAQQIHCSGVIRNNLAALFLAPNAGGKSTVVGHVVSEPILNEDQVILRKEDNEIVAHGTPLGLLTCGSCKAKVGGLFLLEQAKHFKLNPIAPQDVVQALWTEHQRYTFFLPKHLRIRAFNMLYDVCRQAPCYRMQFHKDYVDWDAIDAAMMKIQ